MHLTAQDTVEPQLLEQAKHAIASAQNAARSRHWLDRLLHKIFPKRSRRISRTLEAIDAMSRHLVLSDSRRLEQAAEIRATNARVAQTNQQLQKAIQGVFARITISEGRIKELDATVKAAEQLVETVQTAITAAEHKLELAAATHAERFAALDDELKYIRASETNQHDRLSKLELQVEAEIAKETEDMKAVSNSITLLEQTSENIGSAVKATRQLTEVLQTAIARETEEMKAVSNSISLLERSSEDTRHELHTIRITLGAVSPGLAAARASIAAEANRVDLLETTLLHMVQTAGGNASIDTPDFQSFYLAFENRYRGSQEEIRNRLRVYLPRIAALPGSIPASAPILDLGCGRGEWLELLREAQAPAIGIDTNQTMLDACAQKGFRVVDSDAVDFLRSQPDASVKAITAFHLIEHLPFPALLTLFRECLRVLAPGGLVIFETPSCHNILVGASNFYIDPTHTRPLPSTLTSFALEHVGFSNIETLFIHPYADNFRLTETSDLASRFNDYFYGAQDYALIAHRTTSA